MEPQCFFPKLEPTPVTKGVTSVVLEKLLNNHMFDTEAGLLPSIRRIWNLRPQLMENHGQGTRHGFSYALSATLGPGLGSTFTQCLFPSPS